jgi:cytochrome c
MVAERRFAATSRTAMNTFRLATIVTACMLSAPAWASPELAQKKNCFACHAVDKKVIGPAYKDVAAKYAGQPDAVAKLVQKVIKGGSGVWGAVPMPANPQVNEAEAKQLVQWILTLK